MVKGHIEQNRRGRPVTKTQLALESPEGRKILLAGVEIDGVLTSWKRLKLRLLERRGCSTNYCSHWPGARALDFSFLLPDLPTYMP